MVSASLVPASVRPATEAYHGDSPAPYPPGPAPALLRLRAAGSGAGICPAPRGALTGPNSLLPPATGVRSGCEKPGGPVPLPPSVVGPPGQTSCQPAEGRRTEPAGATITFRATKKTTTLTGRSAGGVDVVRLPGASPSVLVFWPARAAVARQQQRETLAVQTLEVAAGALPGKARRGRHLAGRQRSP